MKLKKTKKYAKFCYINTSSFFIISCQVYKSPKSALEFIHKHTYKQTHIQTQKHTHTHILFLLYSESPYYALRNLWPKGKVALFKQIHTHEQTNIQIRTHTKQIHKHEHKNKHTQSYTYKQTYIQLMHRYLNKS